MNIIPHQEGVEIVISPDTPVREYTPEPIDEYLVIVNLPEDWEVIHKYITEENEIDGIPNRKIPCLNLQEYSLRASVYEMSIEEAEVLRSHPQVERVELNPTKYSQPVSPMTDRFKKNVAFNKPGLVAALDSESIAHTNGIRSNWSITFANNASSEPYRGTGITSTTIHNTDVQYSMTGKNVDAVIIDSGVGAIHPEFIAGDGTVRAKDLILDGPYKVDPDYFTANNHTYTKIIDSVNCGVGIATAAALSWWTNASNRSNAFQSLGTISSISSSYNVGHSLTKTGNPPSGGGINSGHGTACASQIGGKSFGLAFECNIWSIRIDFGDGYISSNTALDICTIFHNAKKISQNNDPDPTVTNNSYGFTSSTGNIADFFYAHGYRGTAYSYAGTGYDNILPTGYNYGAQRNNKYFSYNTSGTSQNAGYSGSGQYAPVATAGAATNSSAESAIAAGVIVVASAGNSNQKLCDHTDVDYNNWYYYSVDEYGDSYTNWTNRVTGVQKGYSGTNNCAKHLGAIRVGALDCGVEPADNNQGSTAYALRKVCYSANGPMINIWAPGEMTMAAGYSGSYEDYARSDDSNFYDMWFNGTSAAGPNACSLICLYLESNRSATQQDVKRWLETEGSVEAALSDPYPNVNDTGYWTLAYNASTDDSTTNNSTNWRGNGNLRGATKRVIRNPYANNTVPSMTNLSVSGISVKQS